MWLYLVCDEEKVQPLKMMYFAAEVEKNSKMIKDAKGADVHVIKEDYLNACRKGGAVLLVQEHSICPWGSDVRTNPCH